MSDVLDKLRSSITPDEDGGYWPPSSEVVEEAIREIERLRAIISPGDAAAYEESHAAKDAEIARLREERDHANRQRFLEQNDEVAMLKEQVEALTKQIETYRSMIAGRPERGALD